MKEMSEYLERMLKVTEREIFNIEHKINSYTIDLKKQKALRMDLLNKLHQTTLEESYPEMQAVDWTKIHSMRTKEVNIGLEKIEVDSAIETQREEHWSDVHDLYSPKDFENKDIEEGDKLYEMVVEGGLSVCKKCGEFEAGLDGGCFPVDKKKLKADLEFLGKEIGIRKGGAYEDMGILGIKRREEKK